MAHIQRLYDFQAGTKIVSGQVDAEFNQLINKANDVDDNKANVTALTSHTGDTTNPHSVTKTQVGLSFVDNTSDLDKPVSTAQQTALNLKVDKVTGKSLISDTLIARIESVAPGAEVNVQANWSESDVSQDSYIRNKPTLGTAAALSVGTGPGQIPVLDGNGKLVVTVLPATAISETNVVVSQAAMLALTAQIGDVAVRTDVNKSYILRAEPATVLSNWQELLTPTDTILSVCGKTGVVVLDADDVGALDLADIIDSLADASADKALSAKQGKLLNDLIGNFASINAWFTTDGASTLVACFNELITKIGTSAFGSYFGAMTDLITCINYLATSKVTSENVTAVRYDTSSSKFQYTLDGTTWTDLTGAQGIQGKSFNPRGNWVSGGTYNNNTTTIDTVYYSNASYYCKATVTSDVTPDNDTTSWGLLVNNISDPVVPVYSTPATETASVISLPSTVFASELNAVLKGNTLKNELNYDPTTWAEWSKNNVVGDATGLEFTMVDNAFAIASIPTNFKPSTNYILVINIASNSLGVSKPLKVDNTVATAAFYIVTSASGVGNKKFMFTSHAVISTNRLFIQSDKTVGDAGTKVKLRDIRVYECPSGSQIETDYNSLSADQFAVKYPYIQGGEYRSVSTPLRIKSVGKNLFDFAEFDTRKSVATGFTYSITYKLKPNTTYIASSNVPQSTPAGIYFGGTNSSLNGVYVNRPISMQSNSVGEITLYVRYSQSGGEGFLAYSALRDGTHWLQLELGETATPYEPYTESVATLPAIGNRLPNGVYDEISIPDGLKVQRVQEYTLQASDITSLDVLAYSNVDILYVKKNSDYLYYGTDPIFTLMVGTITSTIFKVGNTGNDVAYIGNIASGGTTLFKMIVPKGTYANLAAAKTALAGTKIYYQLATPIVTKLEGVGKLTAYPNGSVITEPVIKFLAKPTSGVLTIPDTNFPISLVESVKHVKYSSDGTMIYTPITPDSNNTTTVTLPAGYDDNKFYEVVYLYSPALTSLPSITYSYALNLRAQVAQNVSAITQIEKDLTKLTNSFVIESKELEFRCDDAIGQVKTGSATLTTVGWSLSDGIYSQSISDATITSVMDVDVTINDASMVNAIMGASKVVTYTGGFTVKCTLQPAADLGITYVVRKVGI